MSNELVLLDPAMVVPGCAVTVTSQSREETVRSLEATPERRRYWARAFVTDQILLTGSISDILVAKVPKLVRLDRSPHSIYLHAGGDHAIFYDLCADAEGYLSHVDVEVEASTPSNVLGPARSALNDILDKLVRSSWMPLSIGRLVIHLKGEDEPLLQQFLMPFDGGIHLGPALGGMDRIPFFDPHESLIREAINSPSPFYRFLCAHRSYDGINDLRRNIRELRDKARITASLPPDVPVDIEMLKKLGVKPSKTLPAQWIEPALEEPLLTSTSDLSKETA